MDWYQKLFTSKEFGDMMKGETYPIENNKTYADEKNDILNELAKQLLTVSEMMLSQQKELTYQRMINHNMLEYVQSLEKRIKKLETVEPKEGNDE